MPLDCRRGAVRLFCLLAVIGAALAWLATGDCRAADPATYRKLADEVQTQFRQQVLKPWFPRCIDRAHGGFYPNFLADWTPGKQNDKTVVFQSRMTWLCAQVAMRYPDLAAQYRDYATHGLDFLDRVMWDRDCGGPYWGLDPAGQPSPRYGSEKHAYGVSFYMYAAATVGRALDERRGLELAQRTFRWFDAHAHDARHGGYYEALSRQGDVLLTPPAGGGARRDRDLLGTVYGYKSMNSHIHLLEALTALYEAWPDPLVEKRLREVFEIVREKIVGPPGCMSLYFTPAWRPVPDHDSFGHDVETAYLLLEAAAALKQPDDARTLAVARSLVDHALRYGWDERQGGFYDFGPALGPPCGRDKIWWTQAEGLNALLLMHERFGNQSPRYFAAFEKQWEFICRHQLDTQHGEWFERVDPDGVAPPGQAKGTIWKAAYHNGRALMNVSAALSKAASAKSNVEAEGK